MISFNFNLRNPWSHNDFKNVKCWTGSLPVEHKHWEFEILKTTDILTVNFDLTHRQNHAGLRIELTIFGYGIHFTIYDNRHWDWANKVWVK
jgi:hypothetical protein